MALCLARKTTFNILPDPISVLFTRHKSIAKLRKTRLKNPYLKRHTDFIKLLCIALIKYERIQTTVERAKILMKYGNMLIEFTQRKQPPPDLFTLENGFLLRPDEIQEKFKTKKLINRRWRKRLIYPTIESEEEFVVQCRTAASEILLQDKEALDKLYGELADRYRGKYGGYVSYTVIPNQKHKPFPWLAYVEYQGNNLPPLPQLPGLKGGLLVGSPRHFTDEELEKYKISQTNDINEKPDEENAEKMSVQ